MRFCDDRQSTVVEDRRVILKIDLLFHYKIQENWHPSVRLVCTWSVLPLAPFLALYVLRTTVGTTGTGTVGGRRTKLCATS